MVDEDLARPVDDAPRHRDPVRVDLPDQPSADADERPRLLVRVPAGLEGDVDLHAGRAARLRERRHAEAVEQHAHVPRHRQDVVVGVGLERVEVEEQVVGVRRVLAARVQRVHLDAAEVRDEQQRREVVDDEVVDHAGLRVLAQHAAAADPVGRVRRRRLLVEEAAREAVGHPLHRERASLEVGQDERRHVAVVRDEVAFRVALLGPVRLVQVRQTELASVDVDPPRVAVASGLERFGHLDGERLAAAAALARWHTGDASCRSSERSRRRS